ncbi:hypothetical protein TNCV_2843171 [Trichonephila clavipes]|nr:hypothetical protein TNCV_2843171 [Trichonephila clavipes]
MHVKSVRAQISLRWRGMEVRRKGSSSYVVLVIWPQFSITSSIAKGHVMLYRDMLKNIHSLRLKLLWGLRWPRGQGIVSWQACHEFEPSTTKDPPNHDLIEAQSRRRDLDKFLQIVVAFLIK